MVLVSGIALATRSSGSSVPVDTARPIDPTVTHVSPTDARPIESTTTQLPDAALPAVQQLADDRPAQAEAGSTPGPERRRLELASGLSEIGPGGSRAEDAHSRGAGIAGIAVSGDGILVALTSENVRVSSKQVVEQEIGALVAAHPEWRDFGTVTYVVQDLTVDEQSMVGG
jgi:hypothetical protein